MKSSESNRFSEKFRWNRFFHNIFSSMNYTTLHMNITNLHENKNVWYKIRRLYDKARQ